MITKITFDIQTQQPVYAICDATSHQCAMITTSIIHAIKATQCKSVSEVKDYLSQI